LFTNGAYFYTGKRIQNACMQQAHLAKTDDSNVQNIIPYPCISQTDGEIMGYKNKTILTIKLINLIGMVYITLFFKAKRDNGSKYPPSISECPQFTVTTMPIKFMN